MSISPGSRIMSPRSSTSPAAGPPSPAMRSASTRTIPGRTISPASRSSSPAALSVSTVRQPLRVENEILRYVWQILTARAAASTPGREVAAISRLVKSRGARRVKGRGGFTFVVKTGCYHDMF